MPFVIDCSWSAALFLPDEHSVEVENFFTGLEGQAIHVPPLWWHETANVLLVSMRRKRLTHAAVLEVFGMLRLLPLATDRESGADPAERSIGIARDYALSAYDAAYLELALRKQARLMTLDQSLRRAAETMGIPVG